MLKKIGPKYSDKKLRCKRCRNSVDAAIDELRKENKNLDLDYEDLYRKFLDLQRENRKLKEDINYWHHRCMVAERRETIPGLCEEEDLYEDVK